MIGDEVHNFIFLIQIAEVQPSPTPHTQFKICTRTELASSHMKLQQRDECAKKILHYISPPFMIDNIR